MEYSAYALTGIIILFASLSILQETAYRMTPDKETATILMLPQLIYGLAVTGIGLSLPRLEKKLGKTAAFAAVAYTITGALYAIGWVMNEAVMTQTTDIDANIITYILKTSLVTAIFAQAATIMFFHAAERLLK
jgi:hypothetical protein